jgi:hypothetical protein
VTDRLRGVVHLHPEAAVQLEIDEAARDHGGLVNRRGKVGRSGSAAHRHDAALVDDEGAGNQIVLEHEATADGKRRVAGRRHGQ